MNCMECGTELDFITRKIRLLKNQVEEYEHYLNNKTNNNHLDIDKEEYYIASAKESRSTFHRPSCRYALYLNAVRCPTFSSRNEAIKKGYKPCRTCKA